MNKKILVALDFSSSAHLVAEQGQVLAESMHAELHLVHILADWTYYSGMNYSPILGFTSADFGAHQSVQNKELRDSAMSYLEKTKSYLNYDNTHLHVEEGLVENVIAKMTEDLDLDYIVIGSHGRNKLDRILIGSNTEKVLASSRIPTIVVPIREENK